MGLSELTRFDLFMESGNSIESGDGVVRFYDYMQIKNMYYDSARLIKEFETIINNGGRKPGFEECQAMLESNENEMHNNPLYLYVKRYIENQKQGKPERIQSSEQAFKSYFRNLIKAVAEYQDRIITNQNTQISFPVNRLTKMSQTFLSYAYSDKGLSLALFYYFLQRNGYLYVDWMMGGAKKQSSIIKKDIEAALRESNQFLFLRTPNSELKMPGFRSIRQWCAWECGNYYTINKNEKYYTSFYDSGVPVNDFLGTFKPMIRVKHGRIQ